ncbi:hypothetical protein T4D_16310 [Trichinella pseudospiralis]|uniref:Uncharacterized protein n=1 Tax=Trichinella pseudospiralis TaxID=6337 RepID=A0A0V1G441_TRIPS|nr:hypothetical protein T4D_16310 [Trichinella pseudospiralis]
MIVNSIVLRSATSCSKQKQPADDQCDDDDNVMRRRRVVKSTAMSQRSYNPGADGKTLVCNDGKKDTSKKRAHINIRIFDLCPSSLPHPKIPNPHADCEKSLLGQLG